MLVEIDLAQMLGSYCDPFRIPVFFLYIETLTEIALSLSIMPQGQVDIAQFNLAVGAKPLISNLV